MAFNLNKKKGPISDINVTPLVDVMLVLLVIFMISAPLMFSGVKLDLPKTKKVSSIKLTTKQIILSMSKDGKYFIGKDEFSLEDAIIKVKNDFKDVKSKVLFLRADFALPYGNVAKVMSHLKTNGITSISLVTEIED
ncbi:MAG: biopolymer transporter ExbD [Bacteriovoracaceae bacterium]|jgi:biopolymer transport protein ExbD|nr:biopolymer transporter ExbD [Bacteriovoracaceae bacterium]